MRLEKDVLTTGEVAKICNVASRTVSKWFDSGQLEGYRIPGSKDRRIPVEKLIRFMKNHGIPLDGLMSGQIRVLLVDSDEDISITLRQILSEQTNYEIRSTESMFTAGYEAERFRPHVILANIHIGEDEGRSIVKFVRNCDDLQMTKIIGMTGKLTDGQVSQLVHQGFDAALRKPFSVRQVIEAIEGVVNVYH